MWQSDGVPQIKHRAKILLFGMFIASILLFSRMFYLQVLQAEKYRTLADKNRIAIQPIAPQRGLIFDRNGEPLARNRKTFRAILTAENTDGNVEKTLENFPHLSVVPKRK